MKIIINDKIFECKQGWLCVIMGGEWGLGCELCQQLDLLEERLQIGL
jgi:hypothetical protein